MYSFTLFAGFCMVYQAMPSNSFAHQLDDEQQQQQQQQQVLMSLPAGYHFVPRHFELIEHYLKKKILAEPLDTNIIKETDMHKLDPQRIPFDEFTYGRGNEAYFIVPIKERITERSRTIWTPSGYWKTSKEERPIMFNGQTVGYKRNFIFYQGNEADGEKTLWRMNEFRAAVEMFTADELNDDIRSKIEQYVAYKIRYKQVEEPPVQLLEEPLDDEDDDNLDEGEVDEN